MIEESQIIRHPYTASENDIALAEHLLGVRFPASYREFLLRFNGGNLVADYLWDTFSVECLTGVYGEMSKSAENDGLLDVVRHTQFRRNEADLPDYLIVVAADPYGYEYCLDYSSLANDVPIVYRDNYDIDLIADSFESFAEALRERPED